jgi:Stage II sporulation protein E (SpoIIE)
MWALIGVLAALTFVLGAHSWIGDRQRRRLREDVGLLQSALLPILPGVLGAVATSAAYRPADGPGAGGDFYDMFELGDGRLGVVVGDLSGHGREVLPQTALVRYTLRAYLEAGLEPRAALQTASGVLDHALEVAFATVAVATYDPRERTLTYALAGHPPPIVVGPDGPVPAVTAGASAPVGGGLSTGLRQTTITLPGQATVCFHTDGLIEARRGGELFGEPRLEQALTQLGPAASADVLLARVADQCDHRPDDMAACVLRLPGAPLPPGARVEEFQVDRRELAGHRPEQFLLACGVRPDAVPDLLAAARAALDHADAAVIHVAAVDGSLAVDVLPPELEGLSAPPHEPVDERTLP